LREQDVVLIRKTLAKLLWFIDAPSPVEMCFNLAGEVEMRHDVRSYNLEPLPVPMQVEMLPGTSGILNGSLERVCQ
jgi:hypothetical protein